jgi:hypothetical protein
MLGTFLLCVPYQRDEIQIENQKKSGLKEHSEFIGRVEEGGQPLGSLRPRYIKKLRFDLLALLGKPAKKMRLAHPQAQKHDKKLRLRMLP